MKSELRKLDYASPQPRAKRRSQLALILAAIAIAMSLILFAWLRVAVQTTQVRSTVTVPDGGTVLLGGQKPAGETEREAGNY